MFVVCINHCLAMLMLQIVDLRKNYLNQSFPNYFQSVKRRCCCEREREGFLLNWNIDYIRFDFFFFFFFLLQVIPSLKSGAQSSLTNAQSFFFLILEEIFSLSEKWKNRMRVKKGWKNKGNNLSRIKATNKEAYGILY